MASQQRKPEPITRTVQLLVEGRDPFNFFEAMCERLSLSDQLQIRDFGGIKELRDFLSAFVKVADFSTVKSIAIIRDAEHSAEDAFKSVQASLKKAKLEVPGEPGQYVVHAQPAVGVLILPGQDRPGMLETLLCETFADAPVRHCVDAFFKCMAEQCSDLNSPKLVAKARACAFLATKPKPYVSVGIAAKKGYWDLDHGALAPIHQFLQGACDAATPPTTAPIIL